MLRSQERGRSGTREPLPGKLLRHTVEPEDLRTRAPALAQWLTEVLQASLSPSLSPSPSAQHHSPAPAPAPDPSPAPAPRHQLRPYTLTQARSALSELALLEFVGLASSLPDSARPPLHVSVLRQIAETGDVVLQASATPRAVCTLERNLADVQLNFIILNPARRRLA